MNTLKYYLKLHQLSKLLPYSTHVNRPYMSSRKPTHSQYAHKRVVAIFGDPIIYYNDRILPNISRALSYSAIIKVVGYHVHSDITTGGLPSEEWSEELLWTNEEQW